MQQDNLTMLTDFYEITMGNGYLESGIGDRIAYFDVFFRQIPDGGGFAIVAGLHDCIEYIKNLHFSDEDISYLRSKNCFSEKFLDYLKSFKFTGTVWAVEEGVPVFPGEPVMIVKAPAIQAQLVETYLLLELNHQSLIATKANRITRASMGRSVMEFGARRAQGIDAAVKGARAAYIGGCAGTSCVLTDQKYSIPALGTMAHSWVQMFDSEYDAFKAYCETYPNNAVLLVDTYNVLKSGIPNAIKAFKDVLIPRGIHKFGIRIDSGDISYLSKKARQMLDDAGLPECTITASNSLDEYLIRDLFMQDAKIDSFGVGERLITAKSDPVFGYVYKLAAVEKDDGEIIPKMKISENTGKITNPGFKKIIRFYDNESGKALADEVCLFDEEVPTSETYTIFDEYATWKRKEIYNYTAKELLVPIFVDGECVYEDKPIDEIQAFCADQVSKLWDEVKRFENPHKYYVDLSKKLWDLKQDMLSKVAK